MKAKLVCTMYNDYCSDFWDWVKPDSPAKAGEDYSFLRRGSIFDIYFTPEEVKQISKELDISETFAVICVDKNGNWFGYEDRADFDKSRIWKMIEEGVKK